MVLFLLGVYLGVELLGHIVTGCLTIWKSAQLFPKAAVLFYIPPAMYEGSNFSTSFQRLLLDF